MRYIRTHLRLLVVAASCLALGAGASAISTAGAATTTAPAAKAHLRHGGLRAHRLLARAFHGDLLVATKSGFVTVTFDRGVVQSVNGQQLTLTEGTKTTHKTVTLTIPAGARVRDDRQKATLAEVKPGQRAIVVQAPHRTLVIARTPRS